MPEKEILHSSHNLLETYKEIHDYNYQLTCNDGNLLLAPGNTTTIRDQNKNMTPAQAFSIAISQHKSDQQALRENRDILSKTQKIAHVGSWELDLIADRLIWSDEVYRIFGLKPQEFQATYKAFLAHVHPDDCAMVDNAYSSSLKENTGSYGSSGWVIPRLWQIHPAKPSTWRTNTTASSIC